ncbi:MAG: radical SAM protein [Bacteroidota bacterium]|nr:radical SAM protein [Bacteroidota bacterium]MDP4233443.1 radical SAM protein [Bacteroidota bacterium]MDP4242309.1 radical SAM protein [Bacteroidota bacterium]MDP4287065.1 radical SAM protein [Bacteroidota bacterium]
MYIAPYRRLFESGELARRAEQLVGMLESCNICPLDCHVNRLEGEISRCYSARLPIVSSYCPHFGEEPALVGTRGVGNIFFGNCNLKCSYCQNYEISQRWKEERKNEVTVQRLAEMMIELQDVHHCHAIGFVSPTHFVPQMVEGIFEACKLGLHLPIIYNTNCYDSVEVLRILDGIVDVYLPDLKYSEDEMGYTYSGVKEYAKHSRAALREMYRQMGSTLVMGDDGLVERGLIIRHLVLPNDLAGTRESFEFISSELSPGVTLSVMSQYYPTNKVSDENAEKFESLLLLNRRIREREYDKVLDMLDEFGIENGWAQEFESQDYYRPDFSDRVTPFQR